MNVEEERKATRRRCRGRRKIFCTAALIRSVERTRKAPDWSQRSHYLGADSRQLPLPPRATALPPQVGIFLCGAEFFLLDSSFPYSPNYGNRLKSKALVDVLDNSSSRTKCNILGNRGGWVRIPLCSPDDYLQVSSSSQHDYIVDVCM